MISSLRPNRLPTMSLPQSASTVPLLDVNAQNLPLESELTAAFRRVLHSGTFILGPEVDAFEDEIASMLGVRHAIGVSSGTDAILLALMALDIKPGDEVLCPTYTFFATAGCIARIGAIPVFVDSCPVCFNLSVPDARRKVTSKTRAIIPVHLFGQSAEMDAVMGLAGEHGIRVIEDGAQALGAKYRGRACGTIGDFGTFSFFPSKNLGGFGDGGMLVCNDDDLAGKARILRVHGSKPKNIHKFIGGNFPARCPPGRPPAGQASSLRRIHTQTPGQRRVLHVRTFEDSRRRDRQSGGLPLRLRRSSRASRPEPENRPSLPAAPQ